MQYIILSNIFIGTRIYLQVHSYPVNQSFIGLVMREVLHMSSVDYDSLQMIDDLLNFKIPVSFQKKQSIPLLILQALKLSPLFIIIALRVYV